MTTNDTVQDGSFFVNLSGYSVGSSDAEQLFQTVNEHLGAAPDQCAIDLSEVSYINCTGIGVLVDFLTKFRSRGGKLILINPADHPRKMLNITNFNNIFTIASNKTTARQTVSPSRPIGRLFF